MTFSEAFQVIEGVDMPTMPVDYEKQLALMVARQIEICDGDESFSDVIDRCVEYLVGEVL